MRRIPVKRIHTCVAVLVPLVAGLLALGGCGSGPSESSAGDTTPARQSLSVWAAAGLKSAFTELADTFDQANDSETTLVFDAAGSLQKQIAAGAPADVFASSDPKFMTALLDEGLMDAATVAPFASNEVVLIVPRESILGITGFEDLARADVERIAVANPDITPLGRMTLEEILPRLGILEPVRPKLVYSQTVSQTLDYVNREEVDAGIVWVSEAAAGGDGIETVATSDPGWHGEVLFEIGLVKAGEHKPLAQAFVDFVLAPEGQSILRAHGFVAVSPGD